jgi:hypothetical protein
MASSAKGIGEKYGSSLDSFEKDLKTGVDGIFLDWANVSILIMRKIITRKARTGQASTLASDLSPKPTKNGIQIVTTQDYWQYIDEGVQGVKSQTKAPNSQFKFKNLGVPSKMWKSFIKYVSRTGAKEVKGITTTTKGKSKIQAGRDLITIAKGLAVATKISGIKPMRYIEPAVGAKRLKVLNKALSKEMATTIRLEIIKSIKK